MNNLHSTVQLNHGNKPFPWLGLGVWRVEEGETVIQSVEEAIVQGYRHIDTAAIYQNEEGVGEGIRRGLARTGLTRDDLFITSKLWNDDSRAGREVEAYEESLQRLGLEKLDLYLIHWPVEGKYLDSWKALEGLYQAGRVGAIGVSNFHVHHLEKLLAAATVKPAIDQLERHPRLVQAELKSFLDQHGILPVAWSPLAQGKILDEPVLQAIAERHSKTTAQVVLRWQLQTGWATIPKSIRPARIQSNADLYDFTLTDEEIGTINSLDQHQRVGPDPDSFNF
ncbi:diketogulonate reductase-like aldo/keto reductase [Tumebacillus sp. BK434]|uniref:aldo/keto reductase n=1 Tax=Tumebacillus sp. BK434 TaxID=2512169 RepID=UPI001049980F|nr:aldo/keto reductase [Tumebacillus sp. BK434]TCP57608.1 diketogulonate reductase-like aldo/keto reductase [Tumebacillus sp. BK434]